MGFQAEDVILDLVLPLLAALGLVEYLGSFKFGCILETKDLMLLVLLLLLNQAVYAEHVQFGRAKCLDLFAMDKAGYAPILV